MASHGFNGSEHGFDLTSFLWGDLPLAVESPDVGGNAWSDEETKASKESIGSGDDLLVTESTAIKESSPTWDTPTSREAGLSSAVSPSPDSGEGIEDEEDPEPEPNIDLEDWVKIAAMASADLEGEAAGDEMGEYVLDERPLSYGELSDRLHKVILPRLRAITASKGYLTLGYLARTVADLQDSDVHLNEVRALIEQNDSPFLPSRSHRGVRDLPIWAIQIAQQRFGDLLRDQIGEHVVIERFGYIGIPLSEATRAFLVQAWMWHCLSRAEEHELAATVAIEIARVGKDPGAWSEDALRAREALILDNLWLVARLARRYIEEGMEIDDLLQAGALGLFRAVEKFEPDRGNRFVTYASSWVFQSITRHVADLSRLIRLPVHVHDRRKTLGEIVDQLAQALEREPTLAEISEASGASEAIIRALLVTAHPISIDDPLYRQEIELLVDCDELEERAEATALRETIRSVVSSLTEPQRAVLELRFGLRDGRKRTLEEVGLLRGVTRERIRQIEYKALERLRHPSRAKLLRATVDPPPDPPPVNPVEDIPTVVAKSFLYEFSEADQEIIRLLWGLDGHHRRSIYSTAKRLKVSTGHVQGVVLKIAAFHRGRPSKVVPREDLNFMSGPNADRGNLPQTMQRNSVHPGWSLNAQDQNSADWAYRIYGSAKVAYPAPTRMPVSCDLQDAPGPETESREFRNADGLESDGAAEGTSCDDVAFFDRTRVSSDSARSSFGRELAIGRAVRQRQWCAKAG